jgi:hypothetical protein
VAHRGAFQAGGEIANAVMTMLNLSRPEGKDHEEPEKV